MCHGVPSPGLLRDFAESLEKKYKSKICNVTFREKDFGWRALAMKVYFANKTVWRKSTWHYYYYYFLNNYSLRDSCYGCTEYAAHEADVTMADYWNVPKEKDDNKGVSLLIVNTEAGRTLVDEIACRADIEALDSPFKDYEIYSHANYQRDKKILWQKTYEKSGLKGVSTTLFRKVAGIEYVKYNVRRIAGKLKKMIMRK